MASGKIHLLDEIFICELFLLDVFLLSLLVSERSHQLSIYISMYYLINTIKKKFYECSYVDKDKLIKYLKP